MQQSVQHSISELHYCVITWVESMKPGCRLLTRAPNTDQTGIYPVYLASILHSKLSCFYLKQDQAAWLSQTKPYKDIPAGPDWQSDRVGCRLLWDVRHWCPQMENSWRCWSRVSVILFTAVLMFWFCMFLSFFFITLPVWPKCGEKLCQQWLSNFWDFMEETVMHKTFN